MLHIDIGKCSSCSYIPKNVKSFLNWYIIRDFKGLKPFFSMINIWRSIIIIIIIIKGIIIQLTFQYYDSLTNIDVNAKCIFPSKSHTEDRNVSSLFLYIFFCRLLKISGKLSYNLFWFNKFLIFPVLLCHIKTLYLSVKAFLYPTLTELGGMHMKSCILNRWYKGS